MLSIIWFALCNFVSAHVMDTFLRDTDLHTIELIKASIIKHTTSEDKIIFIGNSVSYYYYSFGPSNARDVSLVPYSSRWYAQEINLKDPFIPKFATKNGSCSNENLL